MILINVYNKPLKQSKLTGKMDKIPSLSTSPMNNPNCIKNRRVKDSICQSCYAVAGCNQYSSLDKVLLQNSDILKNKIDVSQIKTSTIYYRLESHGDIINEDHLDNLVRIVKNNPQTKFGLWTKHYPITEKYFDTHKKPKNLQLQYSSLKVNHELKMEKFNHCDRIFTVYDKETSKKQDINCGAKDCFNCGLCYNKNKVQYIKEIKK